MNATVEATKEAVEASILSPDGGWGGIDISGVANKRFRTDEANKAENAPVADGVVDKMDGF